MLGHEEASSAQSPMGKHIARSRTMRELEPLPLPEQMHGVIADDVAAANGVHADLALGTRTDVALATVLERLVAEVAGGLTAGGTAGSSRTCRCSPSRCSTC